MRPSPSAGPELVVRRVQPTEASALRDVRLRALRSDRSAFGSTFEGELAFPAEKWKERATTGASSARDATWVAVGVGGRLEGLITAARTPAGVVQLFSMWVDPSVRRHGIGGRLLDTALAWTELSYPGQVVKLEVNPRQDSAVRLYLSRGFRFTGIERPLEHTPTEVVRTMERLAGSGPRRRGESGLPGTSGPAGSGADGLSRGA